MPTDEDYADFLKRLRELRLAHCRDELAALDRAIMELEGKPMDPEVRVSRPPREPGFIDAVVAWVRTRRSPSGSTRVDRGS